MDSGEPPQEGRTIPTNLRLLLVLEQIAKAGVPLTPTDVNAEIGLPKPTIHRLFSTLEEEGFLQRELDGRSYTAGRRLRSLAVNVLSSLRVRTARLAVLGALADRIGETCNVSLPDREAMYYLDRVETKWPLRIQLPVGTRVPFYCTASGKMYLSTLKKQHLQRYLASAELVAHTKRTIVDRDRLAAELERTRKRGFAQDDEEFMEGMIALAVPIRDNLGRLFSTLSFHAPSQRLSLEDAYSHVDAMKQAAEEMARLVVETEPA
ncbi:MAG: IclR family transcriptional regulator [Rhodospirillales bacterium]